jgi:hypothetical protein
MLGDPFIREVRLRADNAAELGERLEGRRPVDGGAPHGRQTQRSARDCRRGRRARPPLPTAWRPRDLSSQAAPSSWPSHNDPNS